MDLRAGMTIHVAFRDIVSCRRAKPVQPPEGSGQRHETRQNCSRLPLNFRGSMPLILPTNQVAPTRMARNALGKEVMNIQSGSGNTAAGSISSVTSTSRTGNGRAMRTATSQSNATARAAVSHAASTQNASTQNTGTQQGSKTGTQNGGKPASNSTSTANTSNTANGSKAASGANGSKGTNSSSSITDDPNWLPKLRKSISGWRQQLADAHHRWWASRHDRGARNAARKDERTLQASIASANQFIDTKLRSERIRVGSKINTSA
ncbi:hypothetical protein [Burkholderia gladioli]|uniref:hypothetical protein n=1 Tax=Burkholderia gladioli TaxID=28095 RepID=UPI001ABB28FF|nr:hypothetical protein [Burkholderia gladioli]